MIETIVAVGEHTLSLISYEMGRPAPISMLIYGHLYTMIQRNSVVGLRGKWEGRASSYGMGTFGQIFGTIVILVRGKEEDSKCLPLPYRL